MLFCLAALIFWHRHNFSPRGFVFPDRADTLDRRPRPKSPRSLSRRSRFLVRPSCMLREERSLASRISRLILTLSSRGFVFHDRLNTLERRPRPKLLRRASLRSRFPMRPSSMLQEEQLLKSRISLLILTLSSRGLVFSDRLDTLHRRPVQNSLRRAGLSGRF